MSTTENKELARLAAQKSFVLLKNDKQVLPLKKSSKIAVIGPFADDRSEMLSSWSPLGDVKSIISIYEGLQKQNLIQNNSIYLQKYFCFSNKPKKN